MTEHGPVPEVDIQRLLIAWDESQAPFDAEVPPDEPHFGYWVGQRTKRDKAGIAAIIAARDAQWQQRIAALEAALARADLALAFYEAVVKSGESWTERHERALSDIKSGVISNQELTPDEQARGLQLEAEWGLASRAGADAGEGRA